MGATAVRNSLVWLFLFCMPCRAHAWIFPEHAEITRFAYECEVPAELRAQIMEAVQAARRTGLNLCADVQPLEHATGKCIPYTVLAALAGDHAVSAEELMGLTMGRSKFAIDILSQVSRRWKRYLDTAAPVSVQRLYRSHACSADSVPSSIADNGSPRAFTRELDVALQHVDDGYTSRAKDSRAHFQDSLSSLANLLKELGSRGNVDNALAQVLVHHLRSLQLAALGATRGTRDARWSLALMEHASAVHFLEDAFAAGHMGTEHAVAVDTQKLQRHDFLNRAGLNVQRATLASRCENITTTAKRRSDVSDSREAACWVAYGDGYLDEYNARIVSAAVARLQAQFAMALSSAPTNPLVSNWTMGCDVSGPKSTFDAPPLSILASDRIDEHPTLTDDTSAQAGPRPEFDRQDFARVHTCQFGAADPATKLVSCNYVKGDEKQNEGSVRARRLRVTVASSDFDPYLVVRRRGQPSLAANRDVWDGDIRASATFDASVNEAYEIVVGTERLPPSGSGTYRWWVTEEQADATELQVDRCGSLIQVASLLNPAPPWATTVEASKRQSQWLPEEKRRWARDIVMSVRRAIDRLATLEGIRSAGDVSGATPSTSLESLIGTPLEPCADLYAWVGRNHPFCSVSGGRFRYGDVDASVLGPILAAWPVPMGDVSIIEGNDAFGHGSAVQFSFGGGPSLAGRLEPARLSWAVSGWLGVGISYRANDIVPLPRRENIAAFELNLAVHPTLLTENRQRFRMAEFIEFRTMAFPLALAAWHGLTPRLSLLTGYRWHFMLPNLVPGTGSQIILGHEIEVLNYPLGSGVSARSRPTGHVMDPELRLYLRAIASKLT
jgi:hypothetical protein